METAKALTKKAWHAGKHHIGIVKHRSAEHEATGVSLGRLLMGRRSRTTMPTDASQMIPQLVERKDKKAEECNRRHGMQSFPALEQGTLVLVHEQIDGEWNGG